MIMITTDPSNNIIYTICSSKLSKDDMEQLMPMARQKIETYGNIRWYFEMKDFSGWEIDAFWEDLKFDLTHANDYEKIAMVGEKSWQEWMTKFMTPFTKADVQYFDFSDRDEAKEWIKEG